MEKILTTKALQVSTYIVTYISNIYDLACINPHSVFVVPFISADRMAYEVFLGGSCNPTTWRSEIAIPTLQRLGITYYNPVCNSYGIHSSLMYNNSLIIVNNVF